MNTFGFLKQKHPTLFFATILLSSLIGMVLWVWIGLRLYPDPHKIYFLFWIIFGVAVLALSITSHAWIKLREFRLRYFHTQHISRQNLHLRKIQEITAAMAHDIPMEQLFKLIIRNAHELTDSFFVNLSLIDWEKKVIQTVASSLLKNPLVEKGLSLIPFNPFKPLPLGEGLERLKLGKITFTERVSDLSHNLFPAEQMDVIQKLLGIECIAEIPLKYEGTLYGSISFTFRHKIVDLDFLKLFADFSAQAIKKTERIQALIDQKTILTRIVEDFADAVIRLDPSGKIEAWNRGATRLFGYEPSEIGMRPFFDLFSESKRVREVWEHLDRNHFFAHTESVILRKDNTRAHTHMTLTALFDPNGKHHGSTAVLRDVELERTLKENLEWKNTELVNTNSELVRMNMELKKLSELKTKFLSIASHELRTPLTSIMGYSEILVDSMQKKMDAAVYKIVQTIARSTHRLHRVVNDILDITRLEQNKIHLSMDEVDLTEALQECLEEIRPESEARNIALRLNLPPGLPGISGDRHRLQQVFSNLISNAIKFSPDKTQVEITATQEDENIHMIFSDQGIGIPEAEQSRIFESFYEIGHIRKHSSGTHKFLGGGMGLGLAIARGIVELHGGKIFAKSQKEDLTRFPGSDFHVILPVSPALSGFGKRQSSSPVHSDETYHRCLLVCENNELESQIRDILGKLFSMDVVAETGQAIEMAFRRQPAIILLDDSLKGLGIVQICRILSSQPESSAIPIAVISENADKEVIRLAYQAGASEFISKPFTAPSLTGKVLQLLMEKKAAAKTAR